MVWQFLMEMFSGGEKPTEEVDRKNDARLNATGSRRIRHISHSVRESKEGIGNAITEQGASLNSHYEGLSKAERAKLKQKEEGFKKSKESALARLRDLGVVIEHSDGVETWDIDQLRSISISDIVHANSAAPNRKETFLKYFGNERVISENNYRLFKEEGGMAYPLAKKPLVYAPKSLAEALDIGVIKKSAESSHLGIWDLGQFVDANDEMTLESGETISYKELYLADLIYGDLKGYRDDQGRLQIWDEEKEDYRTFSASFLEDRNLFHFVKFKGRSERKRISYVQYLQKFLPHLMGSNLLGMRDISTRSERGVAILRKKKGIYPNGNVFLDGVQYTLGAEYGSRNKNTQNKNYSVVKLDGTTAGIIQKLPDDTQEIVASWPLISDERKEELHEAVREKARSEHRVIKSRNISAGSVVSKAETHVTPYLVSDYIPPLPKESSVQYAERIKRVASFSSIEKVSDEFSKRGIGIHDTLTWREQLWLTTLIAKIHGMGERVFDQSREFGTDFLRAFLSCEYGLNHGLEVLTLAEKLPSDIAAKIFERYAGFVEVENQLKDFEITQDAESLQDRHQIALTMERLRREAAGHIAMLAEDVQSSDVEALLKKVEAIKNELQLFANEYRTLRKEYGARVALSDFPKIALSTMDSSEINPTDKEAMRVIADENWSHYPALHDMVIKGFDQALQVSGKEFYIVRYEGKIIAFARFEALPNGNLYGGSLNVLTDLRGSTIGDSILKSELTQRALRSKIESTAYPQLPIASRYIGEYGFVGDGVIENYEGSGETFFHIMRDDAVNGQYEFFGKSYAELHDVFESKGFQEPEVIIQRYIFPQEYQSFLVQSKVLLNSGAMVMSAYVRNPKDQNEALIVYEAKRTPPPETKESNISAGA